MVAEFMDARVGGIIIATAFPGTSRGVKLLLGGDVGWRCGRMVLEWKAGENLFGEVLCLDGQGGGFCSHCVSRVVGKLVRWNGYGHP